MTKLLHVARQYNTGLTADQNGVYELRLKFNGQVFSVEKTFDIGANLTFDVNLNEDYIYTCIEVIAPNGAATALEPIQMRILL